MPDYLAFVPEQRFQREAAISPDGRYVAYSSNASGHFNLWLQPTSGGQARQLTTFADRSVRRLDWAPDGTGLYFSADHDGDEQYHLYRVDFEGQGVEQLTTTEGRQHQLADFPLDASGRLLVFGLNDRDLQAQDILIRDLRSGSETRVISPPEMIFWPVGISPDGRWLLVNGYHSQTDMDTLLVDLREPGTPPTTLLKGGGDTFYEPVGWTADSEGFYVRTNEGSEFIRVERYHLADEMLQPVAGGAWDVEQLATSADGSTEMWDVNQAGISLLSARRHGQEMAFPSVPTGVVTALSLSRDGSTAAVQIDSATRPAEIAVLNLDEGSFRYLTDSRPPGLRVVQAIEPETVRFTARDGRDVHGLAYRPHGPGPFPVVMWIHGGPHLQERPDYQRSGLYQYLLSKGIGVYGPNAAGSTGYGSSYQAMLYRNWGGPDLQDFEDALTFLRSLDWVSGTIAVAGASYGGFAALSCLARVDYPWAAGISLCGPSDLVTLATACPPTWRATVDRILGNPERDAELLRERSPISYADNITAPLFVLQGAKDPRVPKSESDRIVDLLRTRGVEVHYDVYDHEGHGFTKRDNEIKSCSDMADFLTTHLGV